MLWWAPTMNTSALCPCHTEQLLSTRANTQHRNHWQNPLSESLMDKPVNRWTAPNICSPCVPLIWWIYWASGSMAGTLRTEAGYFYTSVPCFELWTSVFMFHHQQHLRIGHWAELRTENFQIWLHKAWIFPQWIIGQTDIVSHVSKSSGTAHIWDWILGRRWQMSFTCPLYH